MAVDAYLVQNLTFRHLAILWLEGVIDMDALMPLRIVSSRVQARLVTNTTRSLPLTHNRIATCVDE